MALTFRLHVLCGIKPAKYFPVMLRIRGQSDNGAGVFTVPEPEESSLVVESSLGATFPVEHALRALPIVERILSAGEEWQTNGHSIHLGHYQIERIERDGTIVAGCHRIPADETRRLIAELKNVEVPLE